MTRDRHHPPQSFGDITRPQHRPDGTLAHQIVLRPPSALRLNPRNARTHSKRQIRQLAKSIKAAGFIGAIIIDEHDIVLAGAGRLAAVIHLGMDMVPTLKVSGLTDVQKRVFALADNKIGENAGWNREILVQELGALAELLPELNWDLSTTGFEAAEIDILFADRGPAMPDPEDSFPPCDEHVVTRPSDLWILNRHRVLCGDARSPRDIDRLMGDAQARMAFHDPPYNVRVADIQGRGHTKHPEFPFASGEMKEPEYISFLTESLGNAARVSIAGAVHYSCTDWRHVEQLIAASRTVYGAMLNLCVWAKSNAGQGSFYRSQHELIGVFRVGDDCNQNNVALGRFGRNRSNLWSYPGVNSFGAGRMELLRSHPTVKPVALVCDAMRDCTTKGDIVLDSFLGSGTTILAAEKIGRRGFGLEYEPHYVDVAVRRWEAFTKSEAILDGDGRTYAEIRTERQAHSQGEAQMAARAIAGKDAALATDTSRYGDWETLCGSVVVVRRTEP